MVPVLLAALGLGGLAAMTKARWWSLVVVLLLPLPLYLGIAFGLWGNGFGENWELTIPLWVGPVVVGFAAGVVGRALYRKARRP